jgi:hypothetical protein
MNGISRDPRQRKDERSKGTNALRPLLRAARCEHQAEAKPP